MVCGASRRVIVITTSEGIGGDAVEVKRVEAQGDAIVVDGIGKGHRSVVLVHFPTTEVLP